MVSSLSNRQWTIAVITGFLMLLADLCAVVPEGFLHLPPFKVAPLLTDTRPGHNTGDLS
jgi:hypothetical protein